MGKPRIEYQSESLELSVNREEFFILIHYANTINLDKAKKFYYAGETDFMYRYDNGLSTFGLDYYESYQTYWNISDLQEVVSFMNDDLIPSLERNSDKNLIDILGGWQLLINNIDKGPSYKRRFGILSQGNLYENVYEYIYILKTLKDIIINSLVIDVPYSINYIE